MGKELKNLAATIYLKNGKAVKNLHDFTPLEEDVFSLASLYNDNGVDKIIVFDLSDDDGDEHEKNIQTIKKINRNVDLKVCAGGNIDRFEDIKRLLYADCRQVILNGSKANCIGLAKEASKRFGKDRILVSVENIDFIFKQQEILDEHFHELFVLNPYILDAVENMTELPYIVYFDECDHTAILKTLKRQNVRGIAGSFLNNPQADIMELKSQLSAEGIKMDHFEPTLRWADLKKNSDGMVPVITQDYHTDEVLMLAYMNEEAFETTIHIGKMTYYSRSRHELWTKGLTSGHIQYVKSLTADCDYDTILAKVSQVGAACHTGNRTCFFNNIVQKEYAVKNPLHVFEDVYKLVLSKKEHPTGDSYTNYLFDKGLDRILKQIGEGTTEIIIAAKNPDSEEIKGAISDYLYDIMVLMAEKGVTWEDIILKLVQR